MQNNNGQIFSTSNFQLFIMFTKLVFIPDPPMIFQLLKDLFKELLDDPI